MICLLIILGCTYYHRMSYFIPGPKGPQGQKGPVGLKGNLGQNGNIGIMGQSGFEGPRGTSNASHGPKGLNGYIGEKGDRGYKGYRGYKGKQGDIGERGMKGIRGMQGLIGEIGDSGDAGEYDFSIIDESSCNYYPFNKKTRETKCPYNYVLTGIKNEEDNYEGFCCKMILNKNCKGLAKKMLNYKIEDPDNENRLTKEQQEIKNKYIHQYGNEYLPLFYSDDKICDDNLVPTIKGDKNTIRCCPKSDNIQLNYLKY